MLPALLSSNLCSLHAGVDRLAVSVIWTLSADIGSVKSIWYGRTVIRNIAGQFPKKVTFFSKCDHVN
jgi:DIS3-like exonuclease 1